MCKCISEYIYLVFLFFSFVDETAILSSPLLLQYTTVTVSLTRPKKGRVYKGQRWVTSVAAKLLSNICKTPPRAPSMTAPSSLLPLLLLLPAALPVLSLQGWHVTTQPQEDFSTRFLARRTQSEASDFTSPPLDGLLSPWTSFGLCWTWTWSATTSSGSR